MRVAMSKFFLPSEKVILFPSLEVHGVKKKKYAGRIFLFCFVIIALEIRSAGAIYI